jgi:hypothetical protein
MIEIPEFAKNQTLIEAVDPQPRVKKNAETARDWEYVEEAAYLYRMTVLFKDRFLDPILLTDRDRLPDPVISFENLRNRNTLDCYTLARNPQGLLYQITMNTEHYVDDERDGKKEKVWSFGKWGQLETLLQEQVHLWQQNFWNNPVKPGRSHNNKEFVSKCENLGLHPMSGAGSHTRPADGTFAVLMKELGMEPPTISEDLGGLDIDWFNWFLDSMGKSRKGISTLHK